MILNPRALLRKGWAEAFQKMHEFGDDWLLIPDILDDETFGECK